MLELDCSMRTNCSTNRCSGPPITQAMYAVSRKFLEHDQHTQLASAFVPSYCDAVTNRFLADAERSGCDATRLAYETSWRSQA